MGRLAGVIALACTLAAVGAILVARPSGRSLSDLARYRHYYEAGRQECRDLGVLGPLAPTSTDATTWHGTTSVVVFHVDPNVPRAFRSAFRAGCRSTAR